MNRSVDSPPPDLVRLFEPIRDDLMKVEREFGRHLQSQVALIPKIGKYIQQSGGKRVRPAVLLMAARLCGYQGDRAVLHAAVVEFIHTATLVHDDIIDDSEFRRGRLAVHSQWGNDITVLLGDFLYIKSMSLALSQDTLEIVRLLCDVTLRMIEGELYQLTKNGDIDITEDEHFDIIRRKTAYLFAGCAQIGGMLGTSTLEQQGAAGVRLQSRRRVPVDGRPARLHGRHGRARQARRRRPARRQGHASDHPPAGPGRPGRPRAGGGRRGRENVTLERWAEITRLLRQSGALDYAMTRANEYALAARQKLSAFPDGPERDALAALADYVLLRDR